MIREKESPEGWMYLVRHDVGAIARAAIANGAKFGVAAWIIIWGLTYLDGGDSSDALIGSGIVTVIATLYGASVKIREQETDSYWVARSEREAQLRAQSESEFRAQLIADAADDPDAAEWLEELVAEDALVEWVESQADTDWNASDRG